MCGAALPNGISKELALIVLVVNIFCPGLGTAVAGAAGTPTRCTAIFIGFLQIITFPLIIGWVWAICWSLKLLDKVKGEEAKEKPKPHTQKPHVQKPPQAFAQPQAMSGHLPQHNVPQQFSTESSPQQYGQGPPQQFPEGSPQQFGESPQRFSAESPPQKYIAKDLPEQFKPPPAPQVKDDSAYAPSAPPAYEVEGVPPPPPADTPLPPVPEPPPPGPMY